MDHSKYFSPSSIFRRLLCRGSAMLEAECEDISSAPADWGTFCHYIAEKALGGYGLSAFIGLSMNGQTCDDDMVRCAKDYLVDIKRLKEDFYLHYTDVKIEEKLNFPGTDVFGTADFAADNGTDVIIADLKTGMVEVSPIENPQLMTYAAMKMKRKRGKVILAVSQPRTPGDSLKVWETTAKGIREWKGDVLDPCISDIESGFDVSTTPGEKQCEWCKAKAICESYSEHCLAVAQVAFSQPQISELIINDAMVNRIYPKLALLKKFIGEIEARAYVMAPNMALTGYKLVKGRKKRSWKDEDQAVELITTAGFEAYESKPLTPAKAEKLSKDIRTAIQEHILVEYQKDTIAKESDKRQAITNTADIFGVIGE